MKRVLGFLCFVLYSGSVLGANLDRQTNELRLSGLLDFATAEDTLLAKLAWYRQGNEISERQWRDVLGILRVAGPAMDRTYLRRWAEDIGVADLLDRALLEAR